MKMASGTICTEQGFTLVELLVALFIFSLIAVASVTLLRSSADTQIILKERLTSHSALVRAANLLEADLAQAVQRPVRDMSGNSVAAFSTANTSGQTSGTLFSFTRNGLNAGAGVPAISRVGYHFTSGTLSRTAWPMADGAAAPPPAALLDGLQSVTTRFRDIRGIWQSNWTPLDPSDLPRAVELTITPASRPLYKLVLLVGPQIRPPELLPTAPDLPPPGSGPT
jgi:general secretion pathway protein J